MNKTSPTKIQLAEARVAAIVAAMTEAAAHLERLRKDWATMAVELHQLRKSVDSDLPRAVIQHRDKQEEVVISRRTATTIYTRQAGDDPGSEQAWRQDSYQRRVNTTHWSMFPKQTVFTHWDVRTLIVPADEKAGTGDE